MKIKNDKIDEFLQAQSLLSRPALPPSTEEGYTERRIIEISCETIPLTGLDTEPARH